MVPQQMGMVVEEGGPCFHSGLTTCTHSSSRDLTLTPMRMPMPMPTTIWTSTTTSTRYRLPGTLIASPPPTIISRITTVIITTIIRITITIIVIIITIITITTIIIIRFKNISISPEISVIETPVLVCKVTRLPERNCVTTECSSLVFFSFFIIACSNNIFFFIHILMNYRHTFFSFFFSSTPSHDYSSRLLWFPFDCALSVSVFLLFLFGIYSRVDISVCMFCRFTSQFEPTSGLTYTLTYTCTHIHAHKRSFLTFVDSYENDVLIWILWYGFFVLLLFFFFFFVSFFAIPLLLIILRKESEKRMKKYSISNNFVCIRYVDRYIIELHRCWKLGAQAVNETCTICIQLEYRKSLHVGYGSQVHVMMWLILINTECRSTLFTDE